MLTIDRAIPLTRNHSAQKPNSDNLKLPELDQLSTRAYSSRQRHKSSKKYSDIDDDDLVPGFKKCRKPVSNGRSWSAKPKEEGLAARAKWEVLYEVRQQLGKFFPTDDEKVDIMKKVKEIEEKKHEQWGLAVLKEDDRTTKEARNCSDRANSAHKEARKTILLSEQTVQQAKKIKEELDAVIKQNIDELETCVMQDSRNNENVLTPNTTKAKANPRQQRALSFTKPNGLFSSPSSTFNKQVGFGSTTDGKKTNQNKYSVPKIPRRISGKIENFEFLTPLQQARRAVAVNKKELDRHAKLMQILSEEQY